MKTYGGTYNDVGNSVQQTSDGGFIIAGLTNSFGTGTPNYSNVYLIRTNSSGDTLWTKTFGGTQYEKGSSVQQTSDGGFIITGRTNSFGAGTPNYSNVYLIRTDSSGNTLWTKTFGGTLYDEGNSVRQTSDGGFIIAGLTTSFGVGSNDVYLIKTNSSGDTLWTRTFGGISWDAGNSIQQTSDGGFVIAGSTQSFGAGGTDVYLIRTNSSGDTLWTKTYGGTNWDAGYSVQSLSGGTDGFIIAGMTKSFGVVNSDAYLIRTNSSGETLWTKTFGGTGDDYGYSVQSASGGTGGFIIAGWTSSFGAGNGDVYLIRINSSGGTLWTKTFGGINEDYGYSSQSASGGTGGFIIAGYTNSFGEGANDVYLIKTDTAGLITKINLVSPNGGENWDAGSIHPITWTTVGTDFTGYRLLYSKKQPGWGILPYPLASAHPYHSNCDTIWTVSYPDSGAKKIKIHFDTLNIDVVGDYLYLYDKQDNLIETYNGTSSEFWSPEIPGDTVKIRLVTDGNIQKYGFNIDKYDVYLENSTDSLDDTIVHLISPGSNSYLWKLPDKNYSHCRVKIQILDSLNNVIIEDKSDSNFSIIGAGIEESQNTVFQDFLLFQNYPNPFTEKTVIRYSLYDYTIDPAMAGRLTIYDLSGRLVKSFRAGGPSSSPCQSVSWDGKNSAGKRVASGIYFYKLKAGNYTATKKLVVL